MNKSNLPTLVVAAVLISLIAGCATAPKVNTEYDSKVQFSDAETFAIKPMPKEIPGMDPGFVLRVAPAATEAVQTAMTAKGYTEVEEPEEADIVVLVHGKSVPKTDVTDWGFQPTYYRAGWYQGYPYGSYGMNNVSIDQYDEGTLMIEVYDVETRKMIWVGWVTGRRSSDTSEQAERLAASIARVLSEYPAAGSEIAETSDAM